MKPVKDQVFAWFWQLDPDLLLICLH